MKDDRFLPVEKHQPVEDYDDYAEEGTDELYIGGEADADELEANKKPNKDVLYMAG